MTNLEYIYTLTDVCEETAFVDEDLAIDCFKTALKDAGADEIFIDDSIKEFRLFHWTSEAMEMFNIMLNRIPLYKGKKSQLN